MDNVYVLDASFVIRILTTESGSDVATKYLSEISETGAQFIEPVFLKLECYSALSKKFSWNLLNLQECQRYIRLLEFDLNLDFIPETSELLLKALGLAAQLNELTIYDTIYLAIALKEKAILVTCDIKFYDKAQKFHKNITLI